MANSATPRARTVSVLLREAREARGVSLAKLAADLKLSLQVLSNWERGHRVPPLEMVTLILGCLKVTGAERDLIVETARHARDPNWILPEQVGIHTLREYERTAAKIYNWTPGIIPGLLQIPAYARSIFEASGDPAAVADKKVAIRLERQEMLTRKEPIKYEAVIDARVLRDQVGNEDIMSDQMDHLLQMSRLENVSIRTLPPTPDYHPGRLSGFMILQDSNDNSTVLLEHYRNSAFIYEESDVANFWALARLLNGKALDEDATRAAIAKVAR